MTEHKSFSLTYRVPYSDITMGNHVYYARYIDWMERARNEFFRLIGITFQSLVDQGFMLPVVSCHVDYKAAARYDDEVKIEIMVAEVGSVKIAFEYRITRPADNKLLVTGQTVHVCTNLHEKPQRLPENLVKALEQAR